MKKDRGYIKFGMSIFRGNQRLPAKICLFLFSTPEGVYGIQFILDLISWQPATDGIFRHPRNNFMNHGIFGLEALLG